MNAWLAWLESLFGGPTVPGSIVVDIQAATVSYCKFLPLAESVEALVLKTNPAEAANVAIVDGIAKAICSAVSARPGVIPIASGFASPFPPAPSSWLVNGVPVQGRFI
jgi:hypothetical protein